MAEPGVEAKSIGIWSEIFIVLDSQFSKFGQSRSTHFLLFGYKKQKQKNKQTKNPISFSAPNLSLSPPLT